MTALVTRVPLRRRARASAVDCAEGKSWSESTEATIVLARIRESAGRF